MRSCASTKASARWQCSTSRPARKPMEIDLGGLSIRSLEDLLTGETVPVDAKYRIPSSTRVRLPDLQGKSEDEQTTLHYSSIKSLAAFWRRKLATRWARRLKTRPTRRFRPSFGFIRDFEGSGTDDSALKHILCDAIEKSQGYPPRTIGPQAWLQAEDQFLKRHVLDPGDEQLLAHPRRRRSRRARPGRAIWSPAAQPCAYRR